jgi:hypothetical protein
MPQIISLSTWRLPHWLLAVTAAVYLTVWVGVLPPPHELFAWLANRPDVADAFREPHFGRADALILVFSTLFLGPFALLLALVVLIFALAVLGGFVLPIVRWFGLPDWAATAIVAGGLGTTAYVESGIWLPRSLWFMGLLARACRVVFMSA